MSDFLRENRIISVENEATQASNEIQRLQELRVTAATDRQALLASLEQPAPREGHRRRPPRLRAPALGAGVRAPAQHVEPELDRDRAAARAGGQPRPLLPPARPERSRHASRSSGRSRRRSATSRRRRARTPTGSASRCARSTRASRRCATSVQLLPAQQVEYAAAPAQAEGGRRHHEPGAGPAEGSRDHGRGAGLDRAGARPRRAAGRIARHVAAGDLRRRAVRRPADRRARRLPARLARHDGAQRAGRDGDRARAGDRHHPEPAPGRDHLEVPRARLRRDRGQGARARRSRCARARPRRWRPRRIARSART